MRAILLILFLYTAPFGVLAQSNKAAFEKKLDAVFLDYARAKQITLSNEELFGTYTSEGLSHYGKATLTLKSDYSYSLTIGNCFNTAEVEKGEWFMKDGVILLVHVHQKLFSRSVRERPIYIVETSDGFALMPRDSTAEWRALIVDEYLLNNHEKVEELLARVGEFADNNLYRKSQ